MQCILERLVPNFGSREGNGIHPKLHVRNGRKCVVKIVKRGPYECIINASLAVRGLKLFNAVPRSLRNLIGCSKEFFKKLDIILAKKPDEPQICIYTAQRMVDSNSILDMIKLTSIGL